MNINKINSFSFGNVENHNKKEHNRQNNLEKLKNHLNNNKLIYASLSALALTGAVSIAINKARKGQVKLPEPARQNIQKTFINSKNERIVIDYFDGKVTKAEKYSPNNEIVYRKEYKRENGKLTVPKLVPDENGNLKTAKILEKTKEYIAQYLDDKGLLDRYYRKIGRDWKRADERITKEKVPLYGARGFYLDSGQFVNRFLRSGDFYNYKSKDGSYFYLNDYPQNIRKYLEAEMKGVYDTNRQIIDSIEMLDKMTHSSKTASPMVVYRDAPISWLRSAKDGKLVDLGYCSTSTQAGASFEGMLSKEPTMRYTIELGESVPYWDLTDTTEKEMLLPRGSEFLDLGNGRLRYLGTIKL